MVGPGRLAETEAIVQVVLEQLDRRVSPPRRDLAGETLLVTAGGTREAIDPVRYLGNRSSGKMGYAVAEAAAARGARVILVSGITPLAPPPGVEFVQVTSSEEMRSAVMSRLSEATIVIKAAAVSDYRPRTQAVQKIKRREAIQLDLEPTADILAEVTGTRQPGTLVVGFAAETEDHLQHGRDKLLRKGADALVLNDVARPGIGFDSDRNAATFLTRHTAIELPEMSKRDLADRILDEVRALRRPASIVDETAPAGIATARPAMTDALPKSALQELVARLEFYRELGIYDFYRRGVADDATTPAAATNVEVEVARPAVRLRRKSRVRPSLLHRHLRTLSLPAPPILSPALTLRRALFHVALSSAISPCLRSSPSVRLCPPRSVQPRLPQSVI